MTSRLMSDMEIRRRKKLQGTISRTTGTLGLTALGGTLLATKGGQRGLSRASKLVRRPVPKTLKPEKLKSTTAPILATGAGIGGAGAFNFAAYTNAEGRKRKMNESVKKDWSPVGTSYDPESKRHRRLDRYDTATSAGAGVAAAAGSGLAIHALNHQGKATRYKAGTKRQLKHLKLSHRASKGGLALGAAGGALLGANAVIENKKDKSWSSYSKRAPSAFGIVHD